MEQFCGRLSCCSFCPPFCCLAKETQEPKYARYLSTSEDEIATENIIGVFLELDPVLTDRQTGEEKINQWMEENAPQLGLSESELGINRLKCVKYWEAVLGKDSSKLSGSTVNFCFEKKATNEAPRLLIEHHGKTVFIRNASKRASNKKQQPACARPLVEQPKSTNTDKET